MKSSFVTKTDLAQAYFPFLNPHSARHKLISLINSARNGLKEKLISIGYNTNCREFSPMMVEIIVEHFGNPYK